MSNPSLPDPGTVSLYYHTARNMRPRQLLGVAGRKLRQAVVPALPVDFHERYERAVPSALPTVEGPVAENNALLCECLPDRFRDRFRDRAGALTDGDVTFRNLTCAVEGSDGVDWLADWLPYPSSLWGIQFHGFTHLLWPVLGYAGPRDCPAVTETIDRWVDDWERDDRTDIGAEGYLRGTWTPHAVSLRVLHLVRYCAWAATAGDRDRARRLSRLAYLNAAFLSNHVEHDVGGNHLIENGAALATAGVFFGSAGGQFRRQGVEVLEDATAQFLTDGGHFERSPMYHAVALGRYLTVVDLLERGGYDVPSTLDRVTAAAAGFLGTLEPPDGRYPLLNDSAFGMALPLSVCLDYAKSVGFDPQGPEVGSHAGTALGASERPGVSDPGDAVTAAGDATDGGRRLDAMAVSGYYWLGEGSGRLLVDGGAVGPPHLPAHSHNDQLSVLWWADDRQVLADTGVYEYRPTERRRYARSVEAHNTVQVGDLEPIPTGGSYLFGRRVEPTAEVGTGAGVTWFDGNYRRRGNDGPDYRHRRRVYAAGDWWLVHDDVTAEETRPVRSRLHFDPGVRLSPSPGRTGSSLAVYDDAGETSPTGEALAYCHPVDAEGVSRSESPYFPAFGVERSRPCLTLHASGTDVSFGYLLSTSPYEDVALTVSADGHYRLRLDGETRRLPVTADDRRATGGNDSLEIQPESVSR